MVLGKDPRKIQSLRSHVWGYPIQHFGRFSVASNIGSKLSRKKEKSVKREKEKQNMLVHTLMIKFGKRSFIFSKDVHIRFWGIVEWSCLELQLVLFVLFRITVHRQKFFTFVWDDFTQCIKAPKGFKSGTSIDLLKNMCSDLHYLILFPVNVLCTFFFIITWILKGFLGYHVKTSWSRYQLNIFKYTTIK